MKRIIKSLFLILFTFVLVGCINKDKTKPTITGHKNWTIIVGEEEPDYLVDVSASDDVDGELTVKIKSKNVIKEIIGEYQVILSAVDSSGNEATVNLAVYVDPVPVVKDEVAPVITGYKDWTIFEGKTEPNYLGNVTANDDVDGKVDVTIKSNNVDTKTAGDYKVILSAKDSSDNVYTVTLNIKVIKDIVGPVITGHKDWEITIGKQEPNYLGGVYAIDEADGYVDISIKSNNVEIRTPGEYQVVLLSVDSKGNSAEITINVDVLADTVAPVIKGYEDWTINAGDMQPYYLGWVSASDDVDESVYPYIKFNNVNNKKGGVYEVVIAAVDFSGNEATVTIKVTVIRDANPPVLTGPSEMKLFVGSEMPGFFSLVSGYDLIDGKVHVTITSSNVDLTKAGVYEVVYTATDSDGNEANKTLVVTVEDDIEAPVIHGVLNWTIYKGHNEPVYLSNVYARDNADKDVVVEIKSSNVNVNEVGQYEVELISTDKSGNIATATILVKVILDIEPPFIVVRTSFRILLGNNEPDYLKFVDAYDIADGQIPVSLKSSNVDVNVAGEYEVVFYAVDCSGNETTFAVAVKVFIDTVPPVFIRYSDIILKNNISGYDFTDGILARDDIDGNITDIKVIYNNVDFTKLGVYEVTLSAKDKSGNEATVTINVTIVRANPDLGGYTIKIAHDNPAEIDPFHSEYIKYDREAKQLAWMEVEDLYNVKIQVEAYAPAYPWGELRWQYIIDRAMTMKSEYDFVFVPDSQIGLFAESSAIYDTSYWYDKYGKGFLADIYKTSGTYKNKLYSITDADPMINNVMYYNVNLVNNLIANGHLNKTPAEIFNEGSWTYSAFKDYAIKAQKGLNDKFAGNLNDVYAVSGYATYYWVGMVNSSGFQLINTRDYTIHLNESIPQQAVENLRDIAAAGAMRPTRTADGLSYSSNANSFTKGKGIFDTGELWFVNNETRWPDDMWTPGNPEGTNYGYVPFPRPDGDEFTQANQKIGLGGISTFVMPVGRDYAYKAFGETNAENVYRAFINTFLLSEDNLMNDPNYSKDTVIDNIASFKTGSDDSKEALAYMMNTIDQRIIFEPISVPFNPVVNTWDHRFGKSVHTYVINASGSPLTFVEIMNQYGAEIMENLFNAYG